MKLQNEYLIIVDEETSFSFYQFCNSTKRFNEFLETDKAFKIQRNKLVMGKEEYIYQIKRGKVKGKKQNFFYLTLKFNNDVKYLENYKIMLKKIKSLFYKDKNIIVETLRDDVSFYYSQLSYSLIHEIENLMRKFITYFMITNVGKNWVNESSPNQIKAALEKTKRAEYIDVLQKLDFIHLGDFLFKVYQEEDISSLFEKIKISEKDISINDLKNYIPQSNWDKYFKEKVDCDDEYLKKRWKRLYDLRNKIAHTSHFTVDNYEDIKTLVSDIKEKLEKAFSNIDTIELEEEEKDKLSQNIVTNINENIGIFLYEWNKLEKQIEKLSNNNKLGISLNLKLIKEKGYLEDSVIERIKDLSIFRNKLVHGIDIGDTNRVYTYIGEVKKINNLLQSGWSVEVSDAFKRLGGEATLNEIYQSVEENTHRELTASWKSAVRKTIYYYSSDADLYIGKENLYQKVGKGKWKLR